MYHDLQNSSYWGVAQFFKFTPIIWTLSFSQAITELSLPVTT